MKLTVDVKEASALLVLRNGGKRVAFAVVNALNSSIKAAQKGEQANVDRKFTVRKSEFVRRQAAVIKLEGKGSGFASVGVGRYEARMQVGEKKRLLLSAFEKGGSRRSAMTATGFVPKGKSEAVPVTGGPARPSKQASVPDAFTFTGLRFSKRQAGKGRLVRDFDGSKHKSRRKASVMGTGDVAFKKSGTQYKGQHRTFILLRTARAPLGGVFQRVGPGRDDIRLVYSFEKFGVIKPTLEFIKTAERIAGPEFKRRLRAEIDAAFKFAASRTFK